MSVGGFAFLHAPHVRVRGNRFHPWRKTLRRHTKHSVKMSVFSKGAARMGGAFAFRPTQLYNSPFSIFNSQFGFDFQRQFWDNSYVVRHGFAAPDDKVLLTYPAAAQCAASTK